MSPERPSLTRRGAVVVAAAGVAFVMGHLFGGRALNAVFVPAVALLALGAAQTYRAPPTEVTRRSPDHGHVDDKITVRLTIDGGSTVWTRVEDHLPVGLRGEANFDLFAVDRTVQYEATLRNRGEHSIGPANVTVRDLFGLWERSESVDVAHSIIVFPRIRPLHESAGLLAGYVGLTDVREQFDTIREYEPGDALRDINWKASAKRPDDLVVTEYAGEGAHNRVTIGVEAPAGRDDSAAEAAASVAAYLLTNGLAVGIVTPTTHVIPGTGDVHRRRVLTALARFEGGSGDRRDFAVDPDLMVQAPPDGRHVHIGVEDRTHRFAEVLASRKGAPG